MCFRKKINPEVVLPVSTKEASFGEIYSMLGAKYPTAMLHLADLKYLLCHYDDIALFLAQDETNKMGYVAQERDCDDFAYRLLGDFSIPGWSHLAFGIIWTESHAFNLFIGEDMKVWFIEPQTDSISDKLFGTSDKVVFITL